MRRLTIARALPSSYAENLQQLKNREGSKEKVKQREKIELFEGERKR